VLSAETEHQVEPDDDDDIWLRILDAPIPDPPRLLTWEAFNAPDTCLTLSPYLSERGPELFNAAMRKYGGGHGPVASPDVGLKALFELGLGRSSLIFAFDEKKKTFKPVQSGLTMSGYSPAVFEDISQDMMDCGLAIRKLRRFSERTYANGSFPASVAFATAISAILSSLELNLGTSWFEVRSLLQLKELFEKPRLLVAQFVRLVNLAARAKTDEELSSIIFDQCLHYENDVYWLNSILREILRRVSSPLLQRVSRWVGLPTTESNLWDLDTTEISFISADLESESNELGEFSFSPELLPAYITEEEGELIFETGRSLRMVKEHDPGHVLTARRRASSSSLTWEFEWSGIDAVVQKAADYESNIATAVLDFSMGIVPHQGHQSTPDLESNSGDYEANFMKSFAKLNEPTPLLIPHDHLADLVTSATTTITEPHAGLHFSPPLSLVPTLSLTPPLRAQSRLLKTVTLRLLFRGGGADNLHHHLALVRRFHLLGDGVFAARLSAALFDPSAQQARDASAGGHDARHREGAGLALLARRAETWPPASSELRLALAGLLSECYRAAFPSSSTSSAAAALPGGLGFAIRTDLSPAEQERIMDPRGTRALAFLRLHYAPAAPMDAVVTSAARRGLDRAFEFLLRVLRVLFVAARLPQRASTGGAGRAARLAGAFVGAVAAHFAGRVVPARWGRLEGWARRLDGGGGQGRGEVGVRDVAREVERAVEGIRAGLLLRAGQRAAAERLDGAFALVLRMEDGAQVDGDEFADVVRLFLRECQASVERKRGGGGEDAEERAAEVEALVTMVDFNGFYLGLSP
jgi:hypothetical protein